jgi:hypothetical protein
MATGKKRSAVRVHGDGPIQSVCFLQAYISPGNLHTASVNSICWAPYELGLILACASSDGSVSLLEYKADGSWETNKVGLEVKGRVCGWVSWGPASRRKRSAGPGI